MNVIIIGAGASGIAAALELKTRMPEAKVTILEKNSEIGRKLRATGNGRCNIMNTSAEGYAEARDFLAQNGIAFRVYENGLVYPHSESAADVVMQLKMRLAELGIELKTDCEVKDVEVVKVAGEAVETAAQRGGNETAAQRGSNETAAQRGSNETAFVINGKLRADRLVLATGGKAGPSFGTTGDGHRIARNLGHEVSTLVPVLTPVECEGNFASLAGIRVKGEARLLVGASEVFSEAGEVQFTKTGLSGICVFNMTRHMRYARGENIGKFRIRLNLDPDNIIEDFLETQRNRATDASLNTVLRKPLADLVLKQADSDDPAAIAEAARNLEFVPTGLKGWKEAQCTQGGVKLDEINTETSESKLVPGLYITGELMDYDGPCGGYNLTNAWLTGLRAGKAIADEAL